MGISKKQTTGLSDSTIRILEKLGVEDMGKMGYLDFSSLKNTPNCDIEKAIYELKESGLLKHPEGEVFVFDIPMSTRLLHILARHNVFYLSKLSHMRLKEILRFRNLGARTFCELEDICNRYHVALPPKND